MILKAESSFRDFPNRLKLTNLLQMKRRSRKLLNFSSNLDQSSWQVSKKRANDGIRTREWWNHNPPEDIFWLDVSIDILAL